MPGSKGAAIWSPEALRDIDEIWNYYERVAGGNTAEKILRKIAEVVALIQGHPFAGRSRNESRQGFDHSRLRRPSSSIELGTTVRNIRILDGRRDIEEIFSD